MRCSACGAANPEEARFCAACGVRLAPPTTCPGCTAPVRPEHRFCNACGTPLAAAEAGPAAAHRLADDAGARKVVSIVFADLTGSTSLHERLDAESVRRFMDAYYQAMRGAVESHGGTVTQLLGDGVKAVFGAPRVAEDDAIRAVRAAVAMQRAFAELAEAQAGVVGLQGGRLESRPTRSEPKASEGGPPQRVGLRVAVNTGEVVASEAAEIIGDPVNVAARLQEQARDGDVVIGEATRRLVSELVTLAPLGVFALKGRSESVAAYRVVSLDRPAGASATPFVGREAELRQILAVYEAAVSARRARLAVVLGSPGLGKSRVIGEVARRLGDAATVLSAHCDAAGGATFAPIADALRACLRIEEGASGDAVRAALDAVVDEESDGNRITGGVAALIAGTPASPEETFFVVRRFLAALAAAQPVVLAIDDLQWAEPLLLDLAEHLVQWTTDVPLLVLVAARPELREARSSLATPGGLVAEVVTLSGLDARAAMELAANAIGAEELPAAVAGRVLATSEGNPLFVGELVRMLVQDGTLVREGNRWKVGVELAGLEMPPTIQALLAARIERLRPAERAVLERAAVIGRQFSRAAVKELMPREIADFDRLLEALRRSELVEPDTGWFLGEPALRFHHVLIRDAAYRRLLKNTRAELHERFADWVEKRVGEAAAHDETLGWHLEQAHRHLRELGPLDAHGRVLGERAARVLAAAGRRALARDDVPLAASLLGRALAALDPADPARAELALDWCEALLAAGEVGEAAVAIDELGRFAGDSPRLRAWHTCFAGERAALTDPQALRATTDSVAAAAEELAAAGDAAGEAKAYYVHAITLARLGRVGACEAALDRALAAARRGRGDRRRSNAVLSGAPQAALWGPSPVTRASGRCLDVVRVLRITQGSPAVEAIALRCQGVLEALRGRSDAARRMIATSRRMVEELGITQRLLEAEMFAGQIELIEGNAAAAEQRLRPAYEGLRAHGLGIDAAQAAALLGRALLAQDRVAEAETLSHESEALAGDDLRAAVAWRGVRAEAQAKRGEHAAAIEFARAAVEIAAATDALLYHADARTALAAALRAAGRSAEAAAEDARAIELWEAKGATLLVERARSETGRIDRAQRSAEEEPPERARFTLRRVYPNTATAWSERVGAAVAALDLEALGELIAEDSQTLEHPTGVSYDREGSLYGFHTLLSSHEQSWRQEPLATLGESLALFRWTRSGSGVAEDGLDVGAFAMEQILLTETDSRGRHLRGEAFSTDHLGDAVVGLYERHAELVPPGPEHDRAAATARSIAAVMVPLDPDRWATAISPAVEFASHGPAAYPSGRGADAMLKALRRFNEVGEVTTNRVDDVLALRPDALMFRVTAGGTDRAGGGLWERPQLLIYRFGEDGLLSRLETFEPDQTAQALARFDALTAEPPRPARRVRPNAIAANSARFEAAFTRGDLEAYARLLAQDCELIDHTTGMSLDREGVLASVKELLRPHSRSFRIEPLATLGDSLALTRFSHSSSGTSEGSIDVGSFEMANIQLVEGDAQGRLRRCEIFARDRLGDAIVRLYERYAELLPAGHERDRAATIARSVAAEMSPLDLDRYAASITPAIELVDHRTLATLTARGAEAVVAGLNSWREVADEASVRQDDILCLDPGALLARVVFAGSARDGGGAFERPSIVLSIWGDDGRLARVELFEPDRAADSLARFDALAAEPAPVARHVRPNAATAWHARVATAISARDIEVIPSLYAEAYEMIEHTTGAVYDYQGNLAMFRLLIQARDLAYRSEPLAALGDSLALSRALLSASGSSGRRFDVGAYAADQLILTELDTDGRARSGELFAADRLGDAIVRLYERYAELLPVGPERERAAATARSVALNMGPFDPDRSALAHSPGVEVLDHRLLATQSAQGRPAMLQNLRAWRDLATDTTVRIDDVLALRPDANLTRRSFSGTDRRSGGAFERAFILLTVFGADGLAARVELFELDREADALARFDALTAKAAQPARRVRPNAATAHAARLDAAIAARDVDAITDMLSESSRLVDYTAGATYDDRAGALRTFEQLWRSRDPRYRNEPLATLGDLLALCRITASASGTEEEMGFGAWEVDRIGLLEVGADGRRERVEIFAGDRLGDAVVRSYKRYAELLADGPEHERAAATACSVAALLGSSEDDRWATAIAPSIEFVDHRLLGMGSAHGAERYLHGLRALYLDAENVTMPVDDVLALRSDALLLLRTVLGTSRIGGGAFERQCIQLWVFGRDGLVIQHELFDSDRTADALARFDALTAEPARRRVLDNAATATLAAVGATVASRDIDAFAALHAESHESTDHFNHLTYDRAALLESVGLWITGAVVPSYRYEPLATLGDSLALCRLVVSALGSGDEIDAGAYEFERLYLVEVDARGLRVRSEIFPTDQLGDAVGRLYGRYAELLPAGAARERAAVTAQAVAAGMSVPDPERWGALISPAIEYADHRSAGFPSGRGAEGFRQALRVFVDTAENLTPRVDDVLAVRADAILFRSTNWGTDRTSGGAFDRTQTTLWIFGSDGLLTRVETFEPEREADALARFDALTAEPIRPTRRVRPTAATVNSARAVAAFAARDFAELEGLFAESVGLVDHQTGLEGGREAILSSFRTFSTAQDPSWQQEPLATLGDSLGLFRSSMRESRYAGGKFDVGPYQRDEIALIEIDARGRFWNETFAPDQLANAIARLYERYSESLPEGPERLRAAAIARAVATVLAPIDPSRWTSVISGAIEFADHRPVSFPPGRGAERFLRAVQVFAETAENMTVRAEDVLDLRADALIVRSMSSGTGLLGGGFHERSQTALYVFGSDGLLEHIEIFEPERETEALARFDELTTEPAAPHLDNAASRAIKRFADAWNARDWKRVAALYSTGFLGIDHRRFALPDLDRDQYLEALRMKFAMSTSRLTGETLATRGDRLVLGRSHWVGADGDVGPSETETLGVFEVDERGDLIAIVTFDPDALDAAHAELDARYATGEAVSHPEIGRAVERMQRALFTRDWEKLAAAFSPDFVLEDHRRLGWETLHGDQYVAYARSLAELRPDSVPHVDHISLAGRAAFVIGRWVGGEADGAFEIPQVSVLAAGPDQRIQSWHIWDPHQLDAARARFADLCAERDPLRVPPNAASRAIERIAAMEGNRAATRPLLCDDFVFDDRGKRALTRGGAEQWGGTVAFFRSEGGRATRERIGTRGDRIEIVRIAWIGPSGGNEWQIEAIVLHEVDAEGRLRALIRFDLDDRAAAFEEAEARFAAGEAAAIGGQAPFAGFDRAINRRDWEAMRRVLADDVVVRDHRVLGIGAETGDELVASLRAQADLSPDVAVEFFRLLAWDRHGRVGSNRAFGSALGGGGPFERLAITIGLTAGDRIQRLELFDIDAADAALARFAELCAERDPLHVPPNAASRAHRRFTAIAARDRAAALALTSADFAYEDRGRRALTGGGAVTWLASVEFYQSRGVARGTRELIGTRGDRIAIDRVSLAGVDDGSEFEIDFIMLNEVNAEEKLCAAIRFDADDRRAAFEETESRFIAGEAAAVGGQAPFAAFSAVNRRRDWEGMRRCFADDFTVRDHRTLSIGVSTGEELIASLRARTDLSPDVRGETFRILAWNRHGRVGANRAVGSALHGGGPFETVDLAVWLTDGDRMRRLELFDIDAVDAALARFAELCAECE